MIDCYWAPTANSRKVTMMLEECGLAYRRHVLDLAKGEQTQSAHLLRNPAGAVPVIVDPDAPITLTQSLAICLYLAEKSGKLLPAEAGERATILQWAAFGASDLAGLTTSLYLLSRPGAEQPVALARMGDRLARSLAVLELGLQEHAFVAGNFSLADIVIYPTLLVPFVSRVIDDSGPYPAVQEWMARMAARPAIARGL